MILYIGHAMLINSAWPFYFRQAGQTSTDEVKKRDLRAELLEAEHEARNKKRKAEGKPIEEAPKIAGAITAGGEDEEANKRRKLLQQALEMDKDDDSDDDEDEAGGEADENGEKKNGKGKGSDDERYVLCMTLMTYAPRCHPWAIYPSPHMTWSSYKTRYVAPKPFSGRH